MNNTVRKHPRTLAEAFPSSTEYACAIERQRRIDYDGITIVLVVGVVIALAVIGTWLGGVCWYDLARP